MVNILDIAKRAGVSHGTVSNVLNKKGNVSAQKIKLVEQAANELNYFANVEAKSLRKQIANQVCIIVSSYEVYEYNAFYRGIEKRLMHEGYVVDIYEMPRSQKDYNTLIASFGTIKYTKIFTLGVPFKLNETNMDKFSQILISVDNHLDKQGFNIIAQTKQALTSFLSDEEDTCFITSNKSCLEWFYNNLYVIDMTITFENFKVILDYKRLVFLYGDSYRLFMRLLDFYNLESNHEIVQVGEVMEQKSDLMVSTNFYDFGKRMSKMVYQENCRDTPNFFSYLNHKPDKSFQGEKIRIISNSNPTITALKRLVPSFTQRTGIEVDIEIVEHERVLSIVENDSEPSYDLVRMDISVFPHIAKRYCKKLSNFILKEKEFGVYSELLVKVMGKEFLDYAIPFDTSVQTMMYREDILNDKLFERLFFETYKTKFRIPSNMEAYICVCEFINNNHKEFGVEFSGSMNTSDPNVISADFIAIYYGLGGKLVHYDGVYLNRKIGIKAFDQYYRLVAASVRNDDKWFSKGIEDFGVGKAAIVTGFSNQLTHIQSFDIASETIETHAPYKNPMYGGGVLAKLKTSKHDDAVDEFLKWLLNPYTKYMLGKKGGIPAHESVMIYHELHDVFEDTLSTLKSTRSARREVFGSKGEPLNIFKYEKVIGVLIRDNFGLNGSMILEKINKELKGVYENDFNK